MREQAATLAELFAGGTHAIGRYDVGRKASGGKVGGRASTQKREPTLTDWEGHLSGKHGIGIVPIDLDDQCSWGAIDIDVPGIDLTELASKCADDPVVVFRSKSGGAHVVLALSKKHPASQVRKKLYTYAEWIGHPRAEIFPKQDSLHGGRDVGNWLNMPYFHAEATDRYAVNAMGEPLQLEEGIAEIRNRRLDDISAWKIASEAETTDFSDGPPCLQQLNVEGFPQGTRNEGLFNVGVYMRLKYPDDWEDRLLRYNLDRLSPSLSLGEVVTVSKSLRKKGYFYRCEQPPICHVCDKRTCLGRKFGVGPDPDQQPEEKLGVMIGSLEKIDTDPPLWRMEVDGEWLELETEDLLQQQRWRKKCVEKLHKLPRGMTNERWQKLVSRLIDNVIVFDAPEDAGVFGQFQLHLNEFLTGRGKAQNKDELLTGRPWHDEETDHVYFRSRDLLAYLTRHNFKEYQANDCFMHLRKLGAAATAFTVRGAYVRVWFMPYPSGAEQKEEFAKPQTPKPTF